MYSANNNYRIYPMYGMVTILPNGYPYLKKCPGRNYGVAAGD